MHGWRCDWMREIAGDHTAKKVRWPHLICPSGASLQCAPEAHQRGERAKA